jgi:hypothetical protein
MPQNKPSKPSKTNSLAPSAPQIASSPFNCETSLPIKFRRLCISPDKSAYETLEGPYNFNCYPLAPLGTRAIIYKDSDMCASWAPHGLDMWYLSPSKDHYCCHHYYIPETRGYRISGSANLFPQHCQKPSYSHYSHIRELSLELQDNMLTVECKAKTLKVLKCLAQHLEAYISYILGNPPRRHQNKGWGMKNRGCLLT